ncbi:ABC transporter substrate-binding protein [Azospirillum sp. YIM DDC1]|uniref:ABC transporter substrate-binding protein n=1 Tax=Azospirillum aestuarii TaxID=2802052 RepID=A0ABS1HTD1_9PROT|nr:ABC transporter substrate-binding protein [Azospirillum aestuarii]MBK3774251.1 ABC transporter substrate-binding protein [Azospirillum brasilense]MBK4718087.1 ABC transporter substrate-binding protein [Azospirillum aestuarii]TWA92897.1 dipeptide transport system substrate-binding protein [Azospirillum brasilense]
MKRILLGAGLGVAATLALAAPAQAAKTLVYCSEGSPENFNPMVNTTGTSFDVSLPVYNNLVQFERGGTKVVPGLAETWEVSEDGLTYTFHLRKGAKWHSSNDFKPTRDANADDVLWSFNRQWKKDHPFHKVSGGAYDYFNDMAMPDLLKSIEKIDDYTVKFTLNKVEAPFIANLAMPFAAIQSAEYADALQKKNQIDKIDQAPIGTGPFQFVAYQKDAVIRYKAFEQYWGGKAPLDNLVFAITPDAAVRYAKLKAGECHIVPYPNPADLEAMKKDAAINLMEQEGLNVGYLAFNVTKKPFDDVRVRRALNMAIDKKAVVDAVYQGAGVPAKNPIPPTMWSYNKEIEDYPYDPERAKKLLAEAGFPDGFETDLWAMPVQRPYNPNAKRMAEMMQADLAKVGIKAKVVQYEWGEYRKRLQAGEHQMGMLGWTGDNGDPDNFLHVLLGCEAARPGGSNIAKWCYKEFDDLVVQAKRTTDIAARTKLYEQAQVIFKEEAPWLTVAHSVVHMAVSKNVVDYKMDPFGIHRFYGVDLKQ